MVVGFVSATGETGSGGFESLDADGVLGGDVLSCMLCDGMPGGSACIER